MRLNILNFDGYSLLNVMRGHAYNIMHELHLKNTSAEDTDMTLVMEEFLIVEKFVADFKKILTQRAKAISLVRLNKESKG